MKSFMGKSGSRGSRRFILAIMGFTLIIGAGLRLSSGNLNPINTVVAATTETAEPVTAEPTANAPLLTASLAATSAAAFFAPTITATKSHTPAGNANPGATLTYQIIISNTGNMDALGINFTDTIDPNTTAVGANGGLIVSPIAVNDTATTPNYHTIGNVPITVPAAQGVTANDFNPNGSGALTVTQVGTVLPPSTNIPGGGSATISTSKGSVTLSSNGSFSYTPNAGVRGPTTDTFTYTLANGTGMTDTATVTISIEGIIWFVDNTSGPNGDGRLNTPFRNLVGGGNPLTGTAASDAIFIHTGTSNYNGGLTLLNGQRLIGKGASQSITAITGFSTPSGSAVLPTTGGAKPTITSGSAGVTLGPNNQIWGVTFGDTTNADITGTSFGTLTVRDTTLSGNGPALSLTTGALDAVFQSVSSTNSAAIPINLSGVSGTLSGAITITNPGNIGIQIQNTPLSTTLALGDATVNQSSNTGVFLTNNTGNVSFAALNIAPDANVRGLHATENAGILTTTSGTISTSATVSNTVAPAVEITRTMGTTPLAMALTSVSANGGTDALNARLMNGMLLTNTSGSFAINGTGTAGSGGTIQYCVQRGARFENVTNLSLNWMNFSGNGTANLSPAGTCGDGYNGTNTNCAAGIDLQNVTTVSMTNLHVSGGAQMGINGKNITDLTLTSVEVNNAGNEVLEDGIQIHNLFGTKTWNNLNIHDNAARQLEVQTASGSNNLTITNSFFTSQTFQIPQLGAQGILFSGHGNANIKLTVLDTYFKNCFSTAIHSDTADSSVATLIVERATMEDNGGNFVAASSGSGNFTYALRDSTMWNDPAHTNSGGFSLFKGAPSTGNFYGEITGNTFGKPSLAMSGGACSSCVAIAASNAGAISGVHELLIQNNIIQRTGGGAINVTSGSGNSTDGSTMRVKILNNTLKDPDNPVADGGAQAITVVNGTSAGDTTQTCAEISGNNIQDAAGGGIWQAVATIRIRHVQNNKVFRLPGYTGGPTDTTAVANFLNGQNTLPATYTASATLGSGAGTFANTSPAGSSCIPASPLAAEDVAPASARLQKSEENLRIPGSILDNPDERKVSKLTQAELVWIVQAALERWRYANLSQDEFARLQAISFEIADLPETEISHETATAIQIDETGAGYGWFIDLTPWDDNEFMVGVPGRELQTTEYSVAHGKMDLLTVILRELGKEYLKGKERPPQQLLPLLEGTLSPAVRRLPDASPIGFVIPEHPVWSQPAWTPTEPTGAASPGPPQTINHNGSSQGTQNVTYGPQAGETVSKMIGTIPPGESVTLMFQVTVNNPFPAGVCTVTNTGQVTGSNMGSPVNTNADVTIIVSPITLSACPSDITTTTTPGVCNKVVTYTPPTATTGCPAATITCVPASGATFNKGTTTVTCTASNAAGSADDVSCAFTVTVNDNQAPVFANCSNITANTAMNQCQAVVSYTTTLNDNCPGQTFSCTPASGSTFPKGVTSVSCTGQDAAGNMAAPCNFSVTVNDNQAPTISCPSNIAVSNDPGMCAAVVNFTTPTVSDNCPPTSFAATCVPPAGSSFPKGVTTVTCTATDSSNNLATCLFTVTVKDTEKPRSCVTAPANMISWWAGDGNANDIQGLSPNNGSLVNGPTYAAGKVGQAFSFDGADDRVDVPFSTSLNITGNQLTLDGWINPTANVDGTFYFGRSATSNHPYVVYFTSGDGVHIVTRAGGTNVEYGTNYFPTAGAWTHLALVYDGATMKLYANGAEVFSGAATGNLDSQPLPFTIGNRTTNPTTSFKGLIDEVELFNRALTATEILAIYNVQSFGKCKPLVVNTTAGQCTATNTYSNPTFTDNCAPAGSIVCSPLANTAFPKGVTTVNCTISDSAIPVNTFSSSFEVRVVDTEPPTQGMCPASQTVNESAPGSGSATVTYPNPTSADNCSGQTVGCLPASGSSFPVGTTTVSCKTTDTSGNMSAPCTFTVTVNPLCTVTCPANQTVNTEPGVCTAVATYAAPTTTGSCGPVNCSPASGSTFTKGVTTVTCTPTVAAPPCTFTINVIDNQAPVLMGCTNVTANTASNACSAVVNYSLPTATDNCDGTRIVTCNPAPGSTFGKGVTTVHCSASDTATPANTGTCMFTVAVTDNVPPAFTGCTNVTANTTTNSCDAVVNYTLPAANDNCDGGRTVTCNPAAGSTFTIGVTTVTCSASDANSPVPNTAICSFTVTVNDTTLPVITCPSNITQSNDANQCSAIVSYKNATATDNCSGIGTPSCSPASGATFPKGVTTVTCTVQDASKNTATCTFTVTVNDTQKPAITCPTDIAFTTPGNFDACGIVTYSLPMISDNCAPAPTVLCSPVSGTCFPVGMTTVTCTASDSSGNTRSCIFKITVQNPCTITCPANIMKVNDPNLCGAAVPFAPTTTGGGCGALSCSPASGSFFPKGTTTVTCTTTAGPSCSFTVTVNDTQPPVITCPTNLTAIITNPNANCAVVNYAPAASDNCPGLGVVCSPASGSCLPLGVTTVTCTATDASGNTATCSFTVSVFDICIQDDANAGTVILINSATGAYRFCCNGSVFTGVGTIKKKASVTTLEHNPANRRVSVRLDKSTFTGTAFIQQPPGTNLCSINDRDVRDNTCQCQ
jgi:uncharacterized repeat protein (TIGR01451 family)